MSHQNGNPLILMHCAFSGALLREPMAVMKGYLGQACSSRKHSNTMKHNGQIDRVTVNVSTSATHQCDRLLASNRSRAAALHTHAQLSKE